MSTTSGVSLLSQAATFFIVVFIFVALGPPVGGIALLILSIIQAAFGTGPGIGNASIGSSLFMIFAVSIFSYFIGIGYAFVSGVLVAATGIFLRWNNFFSPLFAGTAAGLFGHHVLRLYLSAEWTKGATGLWTKGSIILIPICVAASLVCWYATRGIIRATWNSAETAR